MTTSRSDKPVPDGIQLTPQGMAQVEAERKRLNITTESLERSRNASLRAKF